ncbi:MAG: ABC transporter permease [Burkholderiales bacterium]|jgi:peptide/nickel transport system permease protein|nr:ABC transporter permease [Burkholderiales bacterium]
MPVRIELLWSDLLVWLLVAGLVGLALYTRKRPHLSAPWIRVGASASGMAAATVLSFFVLVGLLDSVHYRSALPSPGGKPAWSTELRSLLDRVLDPLRAGREKTYSAPLATHLFAKETVVLPDGREERVFPRLRHGGAHLADPEAGRWPDVATKAFRGLALALLLWFAAAIGVAAMTARSLGTGIEAAWRGIWGGRTPLQWRAVLCALAAVLVIAGPVAALAPYYHVLGTDKVGQDVLYQALKSVRTGLIIGTLATLVTLPFALVLGVMAGYFRGWVDDLVQYLYTTLSSIPGVLLIAAAVLMMQVYVENHPELFPSTEIRADVRLLALCVILGITSWTGLCRLLRGEVLKLRELEYVQAAQAFGVSNWRIMMRHLTPNVMHIVMIALVMDFSGLVLAEAVLSYIGVGVDPSMISFGTMINGARLEMAREPMVWWSLAAAFVFMLALVLAANLFADAVRDAFDPRLAIAGGRA